MTEKAISLLERLIATPSFSKEESATADILEKFLIDAGVKTNRIYNNVWALNSNFNPALPTLMLNSHHDTVKPVSTYTRDPFSPTLENGKIYGLGSNDAGGSVVALACTFINLYNAILPFNILLALTAAEEVMGEYGMRAFLPFIKENGIDISCAIVGEPTSMQPAIAERGLLVLDCISHGVSGHAARNEGINAIYHAINDIDTLRNLKFEKTSPTLGPIKITVTQIEAGNQHNIIPDICRFTADVRTTDAYTNEETANIIANNVNCDITPRSTRVWASVIPDNHPLVLATVNLGLCPFVSPTTSDMALMHNLPSVKIGPGESSRSHTANEYIKVDEIANAIKIYNQLILSIKEL